MITVIVGPGYTGGRVANRLPDVIVCGRSVAGDRHLDLDGDEKLLIDLPADFSIIYPVPPAPDQSGDLRLRRFLSLLPHRPARIVYLSTTGVYGNRDGALVAESTAPNPESRQAECRLAAESLLQEWCAAGDSDPVILRVPGIYGPGRLGTDRIRKAMPILAEVDANPGNRIHVDDLASCCIAALSSDVPAGIYNVGDGDARTTTWFMNEVARQADIPPPPTVTREEAEKTFSPMRLAFLRESRIVDITKMRETLGVVPTYANPTDGIAASLKEEGVERN
jgi:nucleoside-diphosphate-sugar epimerase